MAIDDDVRAVYEYLTTQVLPGANQPRSLTDKSSKRLSADRGIRRSYGRVLSEISRRCSEERLPPLASIAINATDEIPGSGYFVEMAQMLRRGNPGGWRMDQESSVGTEACPAWLQ